MPIVIGILSVVILLGGYQCYWWLLNNITSPKQSAPKPWPRPADIESMGINILNHSFKNMDTMDTDKVRCIACGSTERCDCHRNTLKNYNDLVLLSTYIYQVLLQAYDSAENYRNDETMLHIGHAIGKLQNELEPTVPVKGIS